MEILKEEEGLRKDAGKGGKGGVSFLSFCCVFYFLESSTANLRGKMFGLYPRNHPKNTSEQNWQDHMWLSVIDISPRSGGSIRITVSIALVFVFVFLLFEQTMNKASINGPQSSLLIDGLGDNSCKK